MQCTSLPPLKILSIPHLDRYGQPTESSLDGAFRSGHPFLTESGEHELGRSDFCAEFRPLRDFVELPSCVTIQHLHNRDLPQDKSSINSRRDVDLQVGQSMRGLPSNLYSGDEQKRRAVFLQFFQAPKQGSHIFL